MNKFKTEVLNNKMRLIMAPIKGSNTTTVLVMIKTGSRYENKANNGISHFLEHMFFKGTEKRPDTLALSSELDSLGGEYNAFTSKEYTGYWIKVVNDKLKIALDIISDMLLHSKFDDQEIKRESGVIIEELNMYEDSPLMHIEDVFESCLYGDTPAGWDTIGTKKNIRSFRHQDFVDYFNTQYSSSRISVILSGAVKEKDRKILQEYFKEFKKGKWINQKIISNKQVKPQLKIAKKKTDQINLSIGVKTYAVGHPDEFKIKLLAIILGGAMSSRLFIRLRERNGLAYYVKTGTEGYSDSGYLTTQTGVPASKTQEAVRIILEEYKRVKEEEISIKELKRAKDLLKGRLFLELETSDNLANWYGRQTILRKKLITPAEFIKEISQISAADLKRVAKRIFINKNLNLAVIGTVKEKELKGILHF